MIAQHYKDMLGAKSVIRQISEWSTARGAKIGYENVFDYSLGNPSVPCPPQFTAACEDLLQSTDPVTLHGYTPTLTLPSARKAVAESLNQRFGMDYTADHIFMTSGAAGALAHALRCVAVPGQNIVTFAPFFPEYKPYVEGAGLTLRVTPPRCADFQIDFADFAPLVDENTAAVLITSPNNPTTTVMRRESLEKLAQFAVKNDLIVVCDQAFEDSVYDGVEFVTLASLPGMWERTVTVCSISKGMALSGYRVAYIVADDHIMDVYYGSAVSVIGATNTASQLGAIAALKDASFLEEYNRIFDRRRKIVYEIFNSIPGVSMAMPESTFLCWVNVSRLGTADEVNAYIIKEANVVVNAGTPYGAQGEGHLRIVFGAFREDAQMVTALERVKAALMKLGKEKGVS